MKKFKIFNQKFVFQSDRSHWMQTRLRGSPEVHTIRSRALYMPSSIAKTLPKIRSPIYEVLPKICCPSKPLIRDEIFPLFECILYGPSCITLPHECVLIFSEIREPKYNHFYLKIQKIL